MGENFHPIFFSFYHPIAYLNIIFHPIKVNSFINSLIKYFGFFVIEVISLFGYFV